MFRSRYFVQWAALVLVALLAVACDLRGFRVYLSDFEVSQVRGLWVWRANAQGQFQRYTQIQFGAVQEQDGNEFLPYSFAVNGKPVTLNSPITRLPAAPDDLTVILAFGYAPGTYKVSSYNSAGESGLSDGSLNY